MAEFSVAAPARRRPRAAASAAPEPEQPNWDKFLFLLMGGTTAVSLIGAIAVIFFRVGALEAVTRPLAEGQLQRIDERTLATAKSVDKIEKWLIDGQIHRR